MKGHADRICLSFSHCVFSYVSTSCFHERIQSYTGCICWTFLQCVFSRVSSNCLSEKTFSHIGCIFIGPMCTCCKEERMLNSSHIIFLLGPQQNNMIVSTDANIEMQITYHYFSIFLIAVSTIWDVLCWCGESAHSSSCLSRCIQDSWGVLLKGWEERRMWGQLLEPVHCCSESRWK